jgi:hypothetical protein
LVKEGDRVSLTDARMTHTGTVTTRREDGLCTVKWDSGMTERIHESELGRPPQEK